MVLGKDWGFILTIRNVKTSEKLQEMLDVISFILTIRNVKRVFVYANGDKKSVLS